MEGTLDWKTILKVLQASFHWPIPFKDARKFVISCDRCQWIGNIFKRHEMPQSEILEVEPFDVWGIGFMGPFPPSHNNLYILIVVDYSPSGRKRLLPLPMIPRWSSSSSKRISALDLAYWVRSWVTMGFTVATCLLSLPWRSMNFSQSWYTLSSPNKSLSQVI